MIRRLFLSGTTRELGATRDQLRSKLTGPNIEVKVQEDFRSLGVPTLPKLEEYIQACDAVVHIVGEHVGSCPAPASLAAWCEGAPDAVARLEERLSLGADGLQDISYTQWEAYLAVVHNKRLFVLELQGALRIPGSEADRVAQRAHLARLAQMDIYPEPVENVDALRAEILSSLVDQGGGLTRGLPHLQHRPVGAASFAGPVPRGVVDEVANWLEGRFPRRMTRELLMRRVDMLGDPAEPWALILAERPADQLAALLREAREEQDDDSVIDGLLARLGETPAPADFEDELKEHLTRDTDAARALLRNEDYGSAIVRYEQIVEDAERHQHDLDWRRIKARAQVNLAASLNGAEQFEASKDLLRQIDADALPENGRVSLARLLAIGGELDRACQVLAEVAGPGTEAVHQLIATYRGNPPDVPVDDPDVLLQVAYRRLEERRAGPVVELAVRAAARSDITERGRLWSAMLLGEALLAHWSGEAIDRLDEPGTALSELERLATTEGGTLPGWADVDHLVAVCNLLPAQVPTERPAHVPEWLPALEAALLEPDHVDTLLGLTRRWRDVGGLAFVVALRLLDETNGVEHPDAALALAQRAYALLPGYGQRLLLARALAIGGRAMEAAQHLPHLKPPRTVEAWQFVLFMALSHHTEDPVQLASEWVKAAPSEPASWAGMVQARLRRGDVRRGREAAQRVLDLADGTLTVSVLTLLGAAALASPAAVDEQLADTLLRRLDDEAYRRDANAEKLRHQLLIGLGRSPERAIDWDLLTAAQVVQPMTLDDVSSYIRENERRGAVLDRVHDAGAIGFEVWASSRVLHPGDASQLMRRGLLPLVPALPPGEVHAWRGRRCLMGALAVETLVLLGLHRAFGEAVSSVVLFEDAWTWILKGTFQAAVPGMRQEYERLEEAWRPFDSLPRVDSHDGGLAAVAEKDVPRLIAWLGELGALPRSGGEVWSPPTETVALRADAIMALGRAGHTEGFRNACVAEGVILAVERQDSLARISRRDWLIEKLAATKIAGELHSWLGELEAEGKLQVAPVPPVGQLAPLTGGLTEIPWVPRAFAAREQLLLDGDLTLVATELVEVGLNGLGPTVLLGDRDWTPRLWEAHRNRYARAVERRVTLAQVVRELVPEDRREEVVGQLALAGHADAMEPSDVRALFRTYGGLGGRVPQERLRSTLRVLGTPHWHAHLVVLATPSVATFTGAIEEAWAESEDQEPLTLAVLETVEQLDVDSARRFRLLELTIRMLALEGFSSPLRFLETDGETGRVSPNTPGARMWRVIGDWAHQRASREASLHLALASVVSRATVSSLAEADAVLGSIMTSLPPRRRGNPVDLDSPTMAALLNRRARNLEFLSNLHFGEVSAAEWRERVVRALPPLAADGLDVGVDLDGERVWCALGGVLPELRPDDASGVAEQLWPHDGGTAASLRRWAAEPSEAHLEEMRTALDNSPLVAVREDATVVLAWSAWSDHEVAGPRSIQELGELLAEPSDGLMIPTHVGLDARLQRGGAWHDLGPRGRVDLLEQLCRIPGATVAAGAQFLTVDDALLSKLVRLPENHLHVFAGDIANAIVALARGAASGRTRHIDGIEYSLGELAARTAAEVLSPDTPRPGEDHKARPERSTLADDEPALVRVCGGIVEGLIGASALSPQERTWWSWRLFGWWTNQLDRGEQRRSTVIPQLVERSPPPRPVEQCTGDLWDPHRQAAGRVEHRELMTLQALHLVATGGWPLEWDILVPVLSRLAMKVGPDERALRDSWRQSSLGGPTYTVSELSRALLLRIDTGIVWSLSPLDRMAWLDDALSTYDPSAPTAPLYGLTLLTFAQNAARWSEQERERILDVLEEMSPDCTDDLQWAYLVVAASRFREGGSPLAELAREVTLRRIGEEVGPALVAEWLVAAARQGALLATMEEALAVAEAGGTDVEPYLGTLGRVLLSDNEEDRRQGAEVVEGLLAQPRYAASDALQELRSGDIHPG